MSATRPRRGLLAEQQHEFDGSPGARLIVRLHRAAGIEAAADAIRQAAPAEQRRGLGERAVAADEFRAVAGAGLLPARHVHERDPRLKVRAPGIARQQRAGSRLDLGDDERRRLGCAGCRAPSPRSGDRQPPRFADD
jgi:hypothetical protein